MMRALYRRAVATLKQRRKQQGEKAKVAKPPADPQRLVHELEVHQVELEMQNAELQEARDQMELLLEQYTDLYDFAPVGYFTLAADCSVLQVNLTATRLVGIERSRLVGQLFGVLVARELRPALHAFLDRVLATSTKQAGDFVLLNPGQPPRAVSIEAQRSASGRECRVAVMDITERKRVEEAQHRLEVLAVSNAKLEAEIIQRQTEAEALRQSDQHKSQMLEQARQMQEQSRQLSHQILQAQEEERRRISRELHDVIAQTLTGINVRLANLKHKAASNAKGLDRSIASTQRLVERSVEIVHEFARELRPAVLDDLGLVPALHAFMKTFTAQTGVRTHLTAFAKVEQLDIAKRTVLFRVAQEALTNVARHAKASCADVSIEKLPGCLCLKIKDDGKSFEVERGLSGKGSKRLGVLGMRERVEMVGGTFTIESAPGHGTTVRVELPLLKGKRVQ